MRTQGFALRTSFLGLRGSEVACAALAATEIMLGCTDLGFRIQSFGCRCRRLQRGCVSRAFSRTRACPEPPILLALNPKPRTPQSLHHDPLNPTPEYLRRDRKPAFKISQCVIRQCCWGQRPDQAFLFSAVLGLGFPPICTGRTNGGCFRGPQP